MSNLRQVLPTLICPRLSLISFDILIVPKIRYTILQYTRNIWCKFRLYPLKGQLKKADRKLKVKLTAEALS